MPTQGTRNVSVEPWRVNTMQYPTLHQSKLQNATWDEVYVSCTISCKHEHVILFQKNDARCRLTQLMMGTHTSVELGYRL